MAIDVDSSVLWLGVGRGVRVIGSGDIGRILAFLALWGVSAVCSLVIWPQRSCRTVLATVNYVNQLFFNRPSSVIFPWMYEPEFKRMSKFTLEITELLCCEFRYRHRHFQVLEGPKITSMIVLRDINRPLSGSLYNYRVHTGIKSLS